MDTVALPIFPSCHNCLSWSNDGELAVAAGEYVHVLTPKAVQSHEDGQSLRDRSGNWHVARIRVNSFTNKVWPITHAQERNHFSIGREQSNSHVVGLAWSPPGLSRHRRCLLAVLTANLLLTFYEGVAPGKWVRVAIVNHFLNSHFSTFIHDEGLESRKTSVRSFSWCPPLKTPVAEGLAAPYSVPEPESRWGFHLLIIANDDNDVICLRVERSKSKSLSADQYSVGIMCLTSLHDLVENYPRVQPVSLLSSAVKPSIRTTSVSCGPWFPTTGGGKGVFTAAALASVVYGTKIKAVRLDVSLTPRETEKGDSKYTVAADSTGLTMPGVMPSYHFTGPLQWLSTDTSQNVYLAAGGFAALVVVSIPRDVYVGKSEAQGAFETQELPFNTSVGTQEQERHWEPIGAMTATLDEPHTSTLHLGTIGGYTFIRSFPNPPDGPSVSSIPWKHRFDELRDEFDIDRDLGGLAIGRVWGLASHHGLIATAATLHPGDMIDYRSAVTESTNIIISPVRHGMDGPSTLHRNASNQSPGVMRAKRELVIGFILHAAQGQRSNSICDKLEYAAACCAIVESENEPLRSRARETLENLVTTTGADLSEEISKCSTAPSPIEPKSAEQLDGPGGQLFEKCDICDSGIAWYSAQESQCAAGHLFVRCNLSFLSIQEPGISKVCSNCGTEYLSEERIGSGQRLYEIISDAFDTCIYCGGKFRD